MADANIRAVITADDQASKTLKKFGGSVTDMSKKVGLAVAAAGAGLTVMAKKATDFTVDYVKDAKKLGREIGVTVTESSKLLYVTNRLGLTIEQTSTTFGIFSKKIVESFNATAKATTSFEKIGVSVKDTNGKVRSFNEILLDTADKFQKMPDGIEKTALSMELFGRSGKDMIRFLNLGSKGISELEAQAEKLGLTLTPKTIGRVEKYIESQKKLKENTDALNMAIGTATTPILTKFNDKLAQVIERFNASDSPLKNFVAGILAFGGPAAVAAGTLLTIIASIAQIATAGTLGALAVTVGGIAAGVAAGIAVLTIMIFKWKSLPGVVKVALAIIMGPLGLLVATGQVIANLFGKTIPSAIVSGFNGIKRFIFNIPQWFKTAFNAVSDFWNRSVGSLKLGIPTWVPKIGGKGWDVPDIPRLAKGGIVNKPTVAMIGEAGPEAVVPLNKSNGIQPNIIVNIGMYAGTEIEKRKIAVSLMRAFNEAQSSGSRI